MFTDNVVPFPVKSRPTYGRRPVLRAKLVLEAMQGIHACSIQKRRGRDYLDIVTDTRAGRQTREVPVDCDGNVYDGHVVHALRVTLGSRAADRFATCF